MPELAFLGRSNVGKSSLLNCITGLNKNIAVASKTPGRTRCINQFKCKDNEGDICTFVDLPGYGFAKIARDRQEDISSFLRAYLQDRGNLRLAVLLVDIRREAQEQDLGMYEFLEYEGIPTAVVATKCDKLKPNEMSSALSSLQAAFKMKSAPLAFSSETGLGRKDMWRLIRKGIVGEEGSGDGDGDEPEEEDEEAEEPYDEDGDEDYADGYFK
jgi:GTP-binding protein